MMGIPTAKYIETRVPFSRRKVERTVIIYEVASLRRLSVLTNPATSVYLSTQ